ncbi:MAG: single-stranded DNA-binding protein [Ruminococcaceae bacterium]|nr:single-stranded DNA-binding protein [Oscillospiraceae bacterium]
MANFNLNKVIIGGRLTADPELRQTSSGIPVSSFTVAVNRRTSTEGAQQADFINVIAWRNQAEFLCRFFHKGSSICVVGSIQTRSWTDQNNQKRYATEVVADEINFVDAKGESPAGRQPSARPASQYTPESYGNPSFSSQDEDAPRFEDIPNDDDLPF